MREFYLEPIIADMNIVHEEKHCFVCEEPLKRRDRLVRIVGGEFIHSRSCRNEYAARLANAYDLSAKEIQLHFGAGRALSQRIRRRAKELRNG